VAKPYFLPPKPRIFAHRGLADPLSIDENTIAAFAAALEHGATHLESDTQATRDGHAVMFHDSDLRRVAGVDAAVSELTLGEIREIKLSNGGTIPTLLDTLSHFPAAFFNLDIKTKAAIEPTIDAIEKTQAHNRVLVSSFSNPTRKAALKKFSQPVATSASASVAIAAWVSHKFLFGAGFSRIVSEVDALQVPTHLGFVKFADRAFINRIRSYQKEIHFWTINDVDRMQQLIELGADGIVTDRVDLFKAG
jgi:glycerophosphoryl diester phosphodiesterase